MIESQSRRNFSHIIWNFGPMEPASSSEDTATREAVTRSRSQAALSLSDDAAGEFDSGRLQPLPEDGLSSDRAEDAGGQRRRKTDFGYGQSAEGSRPEAARSALWEMLERVKGIVGLAGSGVGRTTGPKGLSHL